MSEATRRITGLTDRAIQRALQGGQHRVTIDSAGNVTILPLGIDPAQGDDAALDAEIRGLIGDNGDAAH